MPAACCWLAVVMHLASGSLAKQTVPMSGCLSLIPFLLLLVLMLVLDPSVGYGVCCAPKGHRVACNGVLRAWLTCKIIGGGTCAVCGQYVDSTCAVHWQYYIGCTLVRKCRHCRGRGSVVVFRRLVREAGCMYLSFTALQLPVEATQQVRQRPVGEHVGGSSMIKPAVLGRARLRVMLVCVCGRSAAKRRGWVASPFLAYLD